MYLLKIKNKNFKYWYLQLHHQKPENDTWNPPAVLKPHSWKPPNCNKQQTEISDSLILKQKNYPLEKSISIIIGLYPLENSQKKTGVQQRWIHKWLPFFDGYFVFILYRGLSAKHLNSSFTIPSPQSPSSSWSKLSTIVVICSAQGWK